MSRSPLSPNTPTALASSPLLSESEVILDKLKSVVDYLIKLNDSLLLCEPERCDNDELQNIAAIQTQWDEQHKEFITLILSLLNESCEQTPLRNKIISCLPTTAPSPSKFGRKLPLSSEPRLRSLQGEDFLKLLKLIQENFMVHAKKPAISESPLSLRKFSVFHFTANLAGQEQSSETSPNINTETSPRSSSLSPVPQQN